MERAFRDFVPAVAVFVHIADVVARVAFDVRQRSERPLGFVATSADHSAVDWREGQREAFTKHVEGADRFQFCFHTMMPNHCASANGLSGLRSES